MRERNLRLGRFEIDLVVERRGTLVFVEVKTRSGTAWEREANAVCIRVEAIAGTRFDALLAQAKLRLTAQDLNGALHLIGLIEVLGLPSLSARAHALKSAWTGQGTAVEIQAALKAGRYADAGHSDRTC